MYLNLFSIFDPQINQNLSLNWLFLLMPMIMLPKIYWFKPSWSFFFIYSIIMFLFNELNKRLKNQHKNSIIFFISIFFIFMSMNFMSLFPYIYTPSTHLNVTLPLSMTTWMSIMMYGWLNKTNYMFAHLVPLSTPNLLMSFMVLIETISNLIRSITLAIRMSTNMISGHLLFCLLTSNTSINMYLLIIILIQMIMYLLEMSVSLIQSYVFMTLSTMYMNEI